jgi:hypothetical protein
LCFDYINEGLRAEMVRGYGKIEMQVPRLRALRALRSG